MGRKSGGELSWETNDPTEHPVHRSVAAWSHLPRIYIKGVFTGRRLSMIVLIVVKPCWSGSLTKTLMYQEFFAEVPCRINDSEKRLSGKNHLFSRFIRRNDGSIKLITKDVGDNSNWNVKSRTVPTLWIRQSIDLWCAKFSIVSIQLIHRTLIPCTRNISTAPAEAVTDL